MASQDEMRRRRMDRFGSGDGGGGGGGSGGGRGEGVGGHVTTQPRNEGMQGPPQGAQLGLSRMTDAEYLFVQQDVEHFEALTGFETENRCDSSLSHKEHLICPPLSPNVFALNAKSGRFALHAHGSKGRGRMLCASQRFTREGSVPSYPHFQNNSQFRSYKTYSQRGQQIFFAKETSSVLCRCVCKNNRSFIMHVMNPDQSVFMIIERSVHLYTSLHVVKGRGERYTAVCAHTCAP